MTLAFTCLAGLQFLLLENPQSTGWNHPPCAESSQNLFFFFLIPPPSASGRAQGPDVSFSHPDGRPSSGVPSWVTQWDRSSTRHIGYHRRASGNLTSGERLPFSSVFILGGNAVHTASKGVLAALQTQSSLNSPDLRAASDCQHLADTATNSVINRSHTI